MKRTGPVLLTISLLSAALLFGLLLPGETLGATAMIDNDSMTATPEEPYHTDTIEVSVDIVFVDAEPVEEGVILEYSLCTETACELPSSLVMTDNGDGSFSASVGPFPEKNAMNEDYIDVRLQVKATYTPVGGGDEATAIGDQLTLYFNMTAMDDDDTTDDDTSDDDASDDDDGDDSPFGLEIVLAGIILTSAYIAYRKRK
jgi:hypothetical protein